MAKKSVVLRNQKRQKLVARYSGRRDALKKIVSSPTASFEEKFEASQKLTKLPKNSAPGRVRNRCQVTGRGRGVYRKLMISRIVLREMAHNGLSPGMMKASW